jgi:hypothetical protein
MVNPWEYIWLMYFAALLLKFFAAAPVSCPLPKNTFFFLPNWWEYLNGQLDGLGQCGPVVDLPQGLLPIGLAVLDMLLRLAGFAAVVSIIIAGAQHLLTDGNPEKAAAARKRLYNSLIGLAIALTATALVTFIGGQIGKP